MENDLVTLKKRIAVLKSIKWRRRRINDFSNAAHFVEVTILHSRTTPPVAPNTHSVIGREIKQIENIGDWCFSNIIFYVMLTFFYRSTFIFQITVKNVCTLYTPLAHHTSCRTKQLDKRIQEPHMPKKKEETVEKSQTKDN